jgi:NO-binding membrane sensor protein with MHYT domain
MFNDFFQLGPIPADQLLGNYTPGLVVLSYVVATLASYIALDYTGRLRDISNTTLSTWLWLMGGSIAMGAGIWSMHFIGMLSFYMPGMTITYDSYWTVLSLFVAIFASFIALFLLKSRHFNILHLAFGGIILGCAIASMHYTGMEAMKIVMGIHYLPGLFILSIIIAIAASEAALWLALKSNQVESKLRVRLKMISASIMGLAICGMHYTGMAAAVFTPEVTHTPALSELDPTYLSLSVAGVTFVILGLAFFASTYKEAKNQQQLELARQLGMAEVAASVLHNVGNVLNSVNVSVNLVAEKLMTSKVQELHQLRELMNSHQNNLGEYLVNDPQGQKIPQFFNMLTDHCVSETEDIKNEVHLILKNVQHIKDIISMQQNLSKAPGVDGVVSLDNIIEEAVVITGLDNNPNIHLVKNLIRLKPMLIDKVKLLQVLVNIITNAKDALKESENKSHKITIETELNNKIIYLKITDTGVGIAPKNLTKIFLYGFSTKPQGHGFGIHSSALAMQEIGGTIKAVSKGVNQGATFILEIPYRLPRK